MKSYYIKTVNGKTVFEPREVPVPQPKAGEVLVKVRAASLNRGEILASISLHSAEVPHPAGGDCAGDSSVFDTPKICNRLPCTVSRSISAWCWPST